MDDCRVKAFSQISISSLSVQKKLSLRYLLLFWKAQTFFFHPGGRIIGHARWPILFPTNNTKGKWKGFTNTYFQKATPSVPISIPPFNILMFSSVWNPSLSHQGCACRAHQRDVAQKRVQTLRGIRLSTVHRAVVLRDKDGGRGTRGEREQRQETERLRGEERDESQRDAQHGCVFTTKPMLN